MRDIRARIAKQSGIDLGDHQIQELAARRLESILDIRSLNPALMEQLRRSAGGRSAAVPTRPVEVPPELEEARLFEGGLRGIFKGLLKLFFLNPRPLVDALNAQARANAEIARREAEREQQQLEWNALHFELLKRLVTEVSRASLEAQGLGLRVESLSAKVDFNDRRVRGLEGTVHDSTVKVPSAMPPARSVDDVPSTPSGGGDGASTAEGQRRKRRRRRGRRSSLPGEFATSTVPAAGVSETTAPQDDEEGGFEDEGTEEIGTVTTEGEAVIASPPAEPAPGASAEPVIMSAPAEPPAVQPEASSEASTAPMPESRPDDQTEG